MWNGGFCNSTLLVGQGVGFFYVVAAAAAAHRSLESGDVAEGRTRAGKAAPVTAAVSRARSTPRIAKRCGMCGASIIVQVGAVLNYSCARVVDIAGAAFGRRRETPDMALTNAINSDRSLPGSGRHVLAAPPRM